MQIDKNIPIPPDSAPDRDCRTKYPVADMEIGDSLLFVGLKAASNAAQYYKRRGWKFTVRKVPEGWRMWRLM